MPPKAAKQVRQIVAMSVKLEVNTPDELKKVVFNLSKNTDGDTVTWTLDFEYHERKTKSDTLVKVVDLNIEIKAKLNDAVETAATEGFSKPQSEFAAGPAAAAGKRLAEGKTSEETASRVIERTFAQ